MEKVITWHPSDSNLENHRNILEMLLNDLSHYDYWIVHFIIGKYAHMYILFMRYDVNKVLRDLVILFSLAITSMDLHVHPHSKLYF